MKYFLPFNFFSVNEVLFLAIVLIFLQAYISEFKFANNELINYLIILPFTLAGTLFAIWMKKESQVAR